MLVKLDVQSFKDQLNQMKQLDESVRQGVVQRADKAFKELDEETKKFEEFKQKDAGGGVAGQ